MTDLRESLRDELAALHKVRCGVDDIKEANNAIETEMAKSDLGRILARNKEKRVELERTLKEAEQSIRERAMGIAVELKDKKPTPGVEIVAKTSFDHDAKATLEYVRSELPALLVVDMKPFKKTMLALPAENRPDCVMVETEEYGQVRIATDLSKVFEEDEDEDVS